MRDTAASIRRAQIDANKDLTFSKVFVPEFRSLLKALKPSGVLEAGAGTGHLARELNDLTPRYVAIEPSAGMMSEARDVLRNCEVELVQSTLQQYQSREKFDLIISNLCLQAVEDQGAFLKAIRRSLAEGGGFVVSIPHPAFFNQYKKVIPEQEFHYMTDKTALIDFQITLDSSETIRGVPYFHRSLTGYIASILNAGLTLRYFKEIFPTKDIQALYGGPWSTPR